MMLIEDELRNNRAEYDYGSARLFFVAVVCLFLHLLSREFQLQAVDHVVFLRIQVDTFCILV